MKKRFAVSTVLMGTALVLGTTTAWATTSTGESTAKITFTTNEAPVIVDPDDRDPNNPYEPDKNGGNTPTGNTGPLTLDYAPNFDFGSNEMLSNKAEFKATDQKPFLQVTDRRVNRTEWEVTVKLGDFIDEGGASSLVGSTLSIDAGTVQTLVNVSGFTAPTTADITLTPGNEGDAQTILTSPEGTFSTWQIYWKGNGTDNNYIKLNVPVNVQVEGTHTATLDWTLTDVVN
ncbi:WxL domain-containing protein [Exiguobacterium acetylicum]|uniref:WxL domain-containing protein n=1 Tax=Exiguobacterium acetylicum TaxID=41170 RepID=UPI001EE2D029|nr:WxL domain-containing protein [Exiguobacterium acetylicum]UKS56013.1 WxL domain-containing protein [Exiguobacterium acetylicum]